MQEPWGKVARWAGIGNNKEDGNLKGSAEGMAEDTMVKEMEEKELPAQSVTDVPPGSERADVAALKAELEQVRGERDQLLDRLARLQAEFENTRRREVKERQDARDYAVQNAVEPFLGVMDNFQLALKSDGTLEQLRAGVELILKQMEEALKGLNVQPVESEGRSSGQHRNHGVSGPPGAGRDPQRVSHSREAAAAGAGADCQQCGAEE